MRGLPPRDTSLSALPNSAFDMSVCAALGPSTDRLESALAAQERAPEKIVRNAGGLRWALEQALAAGTDWIWVLDGSTLPRPRALGSLLDALDRADGLQEADVLSGVTVTPDGQIDKTRSLWYRRSQIDMAITVAERRLLPVRASAGPALVRRRAAAVDLPSRRTAFSAATVLEWTARILRTGTGYLVPESESESTGHGDDPLSNPITALRLLLGRSFVRFDRLTLGYELAERAFTRSIER
jgi:hypothetical protein